MHLEVFGERQQVVVFDGHVLEVLGFSNDSARSHVVHVGKLAIVEKRKGPQLEGVLNLSKAFIVKLEEKDVPAAQQLIAEVNRVRAEDYGLGPVPS